MKDLKLIVLGIVLLLVQLGLSIAGVSAMTVIIFGIVDLFVWFVYVAENSKENQSVADDASDGNNKAENQSKDSKEKQSATDDASDGNNKAENQSKDSKEKQSATDDADLDFYSLSAQLLVVINCIGNTKNDLTIIKEYINQSTLPDYLKAQKIEEIEKYVKEKNSNSITDLIKKIRQSEYCTYAKLTTLFEYILVIVYTNGIDKDFTELESISKRLGISDYNFRAKKKQYDKKYAKNRKRTDESNKGSGKKREEFLIDFTIALMVEAIKADRSKMVCELDVVKEFILKHDKANFQKHIKKVKECLKSEYDEERVDSICRDIEDKFGSSYRRFIIEAIVAVVYADERYEDELPFLKRVARNFDIPESKVVSFVEVYILRKKQQENQKHQEERRWYEKWRKEQEEKRKREDERRRNEYQNSNGSQNSNTQSRYVSEMEKAYNALGISNDASDKEIKARYRNLMRINHPDLFATKGQNEVEKATRKCQEINKAFDVIKASRGMR